MWHKWMEIRLMWRNRQRIMAAGLLADAHGDRRRAAQIEIHRVLREAGLR